MRFTCNAQELMGALQSVKKVMDIGKRQTHVLVKVKEEELQICYSDGLHCYTEKVAGVVEVAGEFVAEYAQMDKVLKNAMPTAQLGVHPIEVEVDENHIAHINVVKFINDGDNEGKKVSEMRYSMNVFAPGSDIKFGILTRMPYDEFLEGDAWDVWEKADLKNVFSKLISDEKDNTIYVSGRDKKAKVKNLNFGALVKVDAVEGNPFAIKTSSAVPLLDVIGRMAGDNIYVCNINNENRFCKVTNEDRTAALWFEMSAGNSLDARAFQLYESVEINDIQMKIHRGAFMGALDAIASTTDAEKHKIKIVENEEGGYALKLMSTTAGGSAKSEVSVEIEALRCKEGVEPTQYEAIMLMKTFKTIITKCEFDWLMMNMNMVENRFAKVIDVDFVETEEGMKAIDKATYFAVLETE